MSRSVPVRLLIVCCLAASVLTGCSRDPNVRKQKYFDSGEKYFAQGKYREAVIQYSNAVQIDDRFTQAHAQLAQAYLKLGDGRVWRELYRTIELAPENYRAHTDLANLLVTVKNADGSPNQDKLKEAKTHLDLLRERQPNNPETHEAWANYYSAQSNYAAAIQEAQQAIAVDPGRAESYLVLALAQDRAKLLDEAEASFKKAIAIDPKSANPQLFLAVFYQTHNHLAEAEQQFKHVIAIDPANAGARAALEFVLMQQGKKDETEAFLKQTKTDLPNNPSTYGLLAEFYVNSGNLDKALDEYASLYRDHPKDLQLKKNYIRVLMMKNQMDEAAKLNNEVLKARPNDVDALIYKGEIQIAKKDSTGAVESLQAALHSEADNPIAHYQLGLAYTQQRRGRVAGSCSAKAEPRGGSTAPRRSRIWSRRI
jgi:tetratricopeptide (TPR) repeat protein